MLSSILTGLSIHASTVLFLKYGLFSKKIYLNFLFKNMKLQNVYMAFIDDRLVSISENSPIKLHRLNSQQLNQNAFYLELQQFY